MTKMCTREVPFTDVVKTFLEIFGVAIVSCLILKVDLDEPGVISGALAGSTAGFVAYNIKRSKRDD